MNKPHEEYEYADVRKICAVPKPYPGLRPFESWEGEIFFGRDSHTDRLLEILRREHFLAVIGPSGCGKSSLVRAGLLPALALGSIGTGSNWRIALLRPGNHPLRNLARATFCALAKKRDRADGVSRPQDDESDASEIALAEAELRRGPRGLIDYVTAACGDAQEPGSEQLNLLILVDQFEELFTYTEAGEKQTDESEAFVNLLLEARSKKNARIFVALTMRTDFLGNCVRFLDLPEAINRAQYLTPRLTRKQMVDAIAGPARIFGGDVEPSLVTELINVVGNDPDQLPILQHALARMWEPVKERKREDRVIRWSDLNSAEVGGVRNALSIHADSIFNSLSGPQRVAAEWLFRAITDQRESEAGGQAVRRPQELWRIAKWSGVPLTTLRTVIRKFADDDVNFVNYSGDLERETTVIDISHEALIRQWAMLSRWVDKEARLSVEYRQLRERSRDEHGKSGSPLTGTNLARAVEWKSLRKLDQSAGAADATWQPNAAWASRYAREQGGSAEKEFKDVIAYIDSSHEILKRNERRERRIRRTLIGLTFVCVISLAISVWFGMKNKRTQSAMEAQVLWHPLNFTSDPISPEQASGLLALARADQETRSAFLERLPQNDELSRRFEIQPTLVLKSAVGTSPRIRDHFIDELESSHPVQQPNEVRTVARVAALLGLERDVPVSDLIAAILQAQSSQDLTVLGAGLKTMVKNLDAAQTARAADAIFAAISQTTDSGQLRALGRGLEATSDKLDPGQAVAKYVKALQMTNSNRRFQTIGLGLKTLSEHLTQDQAYEVVSTYLDAATRPKAPGANTEDLFSFDDDTTDYSGLESTAAKLSGSQAMSLVDNYLPYVEGPSDTSGIVLVNTVLVANASKFSANELDALISAEAELVRKSEDWQVATQLGDLLSRLDGPNALAAAKTMMSELEAHNTVDSLSVLGLALAQISSKLSAQQSSRAVHLYLAAAAKKSERAALLSQALAGVAGSLSVAQAASLADMYVELMQDGQRNILSLGFWVKRGLLPVEDGLGHAQAMVFATRFTSAISRLRNPRESERWGDVLAGAAHRLSDEDAHAMTEILLSQIRSASNAAQLAALARGLAAVPGGLNDSEADSLIKTFVDAMSIMEDAEYLDRPLAELMTKFSDAKADNVVNQLLALRHGPANPKGNLDAPLLRQAVDMPPSLQSPAQRALPLQALAAPRQFSNAQATQVLYELLADLSRQSSDYNLFVFEGYPPQSSRRLAGEASSSSRRGAPPPITRSIQGRHDAEFHSLTEGVVNVTKKLTPKQSLIVWESFVNAIPSITSGETLEFLAGPLAVLASKIPMDEAHATRMVDLCKYPLLQCPAFMESVRAHYPEAPKADAGYWAFVTWAHKRFPQFDPDASPPLHSVQAMRLN